MLTCPACGTETPDDTPSCQRCHLSTQLFDPVREAAGIPPGDPAYLGAVREILQSIGDAAGPQDPPIVLPAEISYAARFPAVGAPRPAAPAGPLGPKALEVLPERRALPPGTGIAVLRRQVDEYLVLARRQGLDLSDFAARSRDAVLSQDALSLEVLSRDLFVHLAASLTIQYESVLVKRNELSGLAPTPTPDVELEACRSALELGDLAGAQRRLRHIEELLTQTEEEWATVQILIAEGDLIAETVRSLGGDPAPALGPFEEGKRLARDGARAEAEPVLASATLALWTTLSPVLANDLRRLKAVLQQAQAEGVDVSVAAEGLHEMATHLHHRNFASAIAAYRRVNASLRPSRSNGADVPTTETAESRPSGEVPSSPGNTD